ncbi:RNA-binding domain-containing protein [Candidatus Uabimicrobium amorphum]|uniref:Transcriptional regulator n=1 Tax=Uabimicrobium amorphum TaxID=2596890 RepID=A0A5S9IIN0_UABAM|nr:RNA-binding domain-containing protein [Candidatus Uabimicrobium amorphum]BBM82091.1 transcriptional regulator [Candidatus Uabimicrobium amorphum]
MNNTEAKKKLDELISLPEETEWLEFKRNNSSPDKIGEYISAISNAVTLHQKKEGYIVWGIEDNTKKIVGTNYSFRKQKIGNQELESWLLQLLTPRIDFVIQEFIYDNKAIVMLIIQPAKHMPVRFKGEEFIRVGSCKRKLKDFPEKERKLWQILSKEDWSAQICKEATVANLDSKALLFAREQYKEKNSKRSLEIDQWDDTTFLNKAKVCINGQITNTALLLLGKEESEHLLTPALAKITWILKDVHGIEKDYQHFHPPLLLAVNQVLNKIRNLTIRKLPSGTLFPIEITQYDPWVIREMLHNCIAHQDYSLSARINVVEESDSVLFTNLGNFIPGSVEVVIRQDAPQEQYRNPFLAQAMVNLNMIDTIGSGIKRMFLLQKKRFFPMPDYDLSEPQRVKARVFGKIIDENYTNLLIKETNLDLLNVISLDKVQKKRKISNEEFKSLKTLKLVEGRRPNLFVSDKIAAVTGKKAAYIKQRAFNKAHYEKMIISYLEKFGEATRKDLEELLIDKISDVLNNKQKKNKIAYILQQMKKANTIYPTGANRWTTWRLCLKKKER